MKDENFVCNFGDISPQDTDKFNYKGPELEEIQDAKSVTISIQKEKSLGRRLRVNVKSREGFTDAELKRHVSAMILVEKVINSLEWKNWVLAQKFTTTNKTASQIYDHIMTGEEVLQKGVDYEMDAEIEMYYTKNNIVGYTYSNVNKTWVNRYVTKDYSEEEIAGNFMHEWIHKMGYGHSSASDHSSAPYALGYGMRDWIKKYKSGIKLVDLYPEVVVTAPVVIVPATPTTPAIETPPIKIPVPTVEPKKVCYRPWYYLGLITVCNYEK